MATRFVKVFFRGSVRAERRGIFLRVTSDTLASLQGYEVDEQGEEIMPNGFERRLRIISRRAIIGVHEYVESKKYGTLVRAEEESQS